MKNKKITCFSLMLQFLDIFYELLDYLTFFSKILINTALQQQQQCMQCSKCIFRASEGFKFTSQQPAMVTTMKIVSKGILAGVSVTQKNAAIEDHRKNLL